MEVYTSDRPINKGLENEYNHSIFLAGPTPRSDDVKSWRPKAIGILGNMDYNGLVWTPEVQGEAKYDYIHQVEWEKWGLNACKKIVFWIPRSIPDMPAFTTNVEFGRYVDSGRVIYGRPDEAVKCAYLDWMYKDLTGKDPINNLENLLKESIEY